MSTQPDKSSLGDFNKEYERNPLGPSRHTLTSYQPKVDRAWQHNKAYKKSCPQSLHIEARLKGRLFRHYLKAFLFFFLYHLWVTFIDTLDLKRIRV